MGKHKSLFARNEKILNLQKQGLMHEEIAEILGCSAGIVGRVLRDNGIYGISDKGKANQVICIKEQLWRKIQILTS